MNEDLMSSILRSQTKLEGQQAIMASGMTNAAGAYPAGAYPYTTTVASKSLHPKQPTMTMQVPLRAAAAICTAKGQSDLSNAYNLLADLGAVCLITVDISDCVKELSELYTRRNSAEVLKELQEEKDDISSKLDIV